MKKFIIGTLGVLFASAIAVAVWTSNVKANDLLAMNVEALAVKSWNKHESGFYAVGFPGTNYHVYWVECARYELRETLVTETNDSSTKDSYNDNGGVTTNGKSTTVNYGGNSSNSNTTSSNVKTVKAPTLMSTFSTSACGAGSGPCKWYQTGHYNGNPCD